MDNYKAYKQKSLQTLGVLKFKVEHFIENYKELQDSNLQICRKLAIVNYRIMKINHEIECMECPVSRPLETGQESPQLEHLIRDMEADVHYLEGDRAKLNGDLAVNISDIDECKFQIDLNIGLFKKEKDSCKNSKEDFEISDSIAKLLAIEANYKNDKNKN